MPEGRAKAAGAAGAGAAVRGGGRPLGGSPGEGFCVGGKGALAAKGSGARGAPAKMRSSGVGARVPGAAVGAAGALGAPGRVKWRAAPGLGATCAGAEGVRGRVKPEVAKGAAGALGALSGGSSWKLPWARDAERLSSCKSRDSNAGGRAGRAASSAQAGHSPKRGSSAPHFKHFDTARHERRNAAPTQESGVPFFPLLKKKGRRFFHTP